MCDQQSLRSACANTQSGQSLCLSLDYFMTVKLLTEPHLEFLSLKGVCTGSSWVYTWQNATLLEITCHGSYKLDLPATILSRAATRPIAMTTELVWLDHQVGTNDTSHILLVIKAIRPRIRPQQNKHLKQTENWRILHEWSFHMKYNYP